MNGVFPIPPLFILWLPCLVIVLLCLVTIVSCFVIILACLVIVVPCLVLSCLTILCFTPSRRHYGIERFWLFDHWGGTLASLSLSCHVLSCFVCLALGYMIPPWPCLAFVLSCDCFYLLVSWSSFLLPWFILSCLVFRFFCLALASQAMDPSVGDGYRVVYERECHFELRVHDEIEPNGTLEVR